MKHWKAKLGVPLLSAGLLLSAVAPASAAGTGDVPTNLPTNVLSSKSFQGGPFDPGLVNEDLLLKSLVKQGIVDKKASKDTQHNQMTTYLKNRQEKTAKSVDDKEQAKAFSKIGKPGAKGHKSNSKKDNGQPFLNGNGHKYGHRNKLDPIQKENYDGWQRDDNVLVVLMEYPDAPHNTITPDETDMYYKDYTKEHYQKMIFGQNGYTGPDGKNLISMKQFYDEQSGGSYTVDGNVAGWYMAKHPAAYYGGNDPQSGSDSNPRALIKEALQNVAKDPSIDLNKYDKLDRYDLDGDGNTNEPDGMIDHLMVIHSGVGEEAGGGSLSSDAIWSHRWNLGSLYQIPGSHADNGVLSPMMLAYDYTVEPEDGAAGVFSHEYGHDLGLPDEYDTIYSHNAVGEPVGYWSLMSSGSWTGAIPGTEPSGFGTYDKEYLQSTMPKGNWLKGTSLNLSDLTKQGQTITLDESAVKGTNTDAVRVSLPDKLTTITTPPSGTYAYFSGHGNNIDNTMTTSVDLTGKTNAELSFKTWYQIESDYDYAYIEVKDGDQWVPIAGNITTTNDPNHSNLGNGITGTSDGWVNATFDLSAFAGKKVDLRFRYVGDPGVALDGFFADDIKVTADGQTVLSDNADGTDSAFTFDGFSKNDGEKRTEQYYLLEWRNDQGSDSGLAHIRRGASLMSYDSGLLVWYVDNSFDNNWVGDHPGDGFLGVVDAHQQLAKWSDGSVASTKYQIEDAAFSLDRTDKEFLDYTDSLGIYLAKKAEKPVPVFDDSKDYSDPGLIYAGRNVPNLGLKVSVVAESKDKSTARIHISKK